MPVFKVDRSFGPFTWAGLSSLRTVSFLKIGYVGAIAIPIASYALRFLQDFGISFALPVTLFWTYLSSVLLATGHLLNEVSCPQIIKRYQTLHEFRAYLTDSFAYQASIQEASKKNISNRILKELKEDKKIPPEDMQHVAVIIAEAYISALNQSMAQDPMPEMEWEVKNQEKPVLRFFIVGFYAAAVIIALILSLRQFWMVWKATFVCYLS